VIAALLTCAAALAAAPQSLEATSTLAPAPGAEAATGAPLHWTVTLRGADAASATVEGALRPGPEWAVLEGPVPVVDADVPAAERPGLQLRWTLMGLEAGELRAPSISFDVGGEEPLAVEPASVTLTGALGADEDAPRALRGFRAVEEEPAGDADLALLLGAALAVAALGALALALTRRRRPQALAEAPTVDLLARIDGLDAAARPAETMGELAPLLRRAVDEARGVHRGALTDGEWAAALESDAQLDEARRTDLGALVRELSVARFGGARPSSFAAREAQERASGHVRALRSLGALGEEAPA
jgi:hypothetical protein